MTTPTLAMLPPRATLDCSTTADPEAIKSARLKLPQSLPQEGLGDEETRRLLFETIAPALAPGHAGPRYYGFVTGGTTPISLIADAVTSSFDNNVQVHLPNETISTYVEARALDLVLELLNIPPSHFQGRTITTGATASNVLGMALGRQFAIATVKGPAYSVAEEGFGGVTVEVLAAGAHASIRKAASIVGIGRSRVKDLTRETEGLPVAFEIDALEEHLRDAQAAGRGVIVCPAYGEVNTGAFTPDMSRLRQLCDTYGAWMHLDAAFGGFGALHPDFAEEVQKGMLLADSLTLDGHKWLNVPYDCGLFYTRASASLEAVCGPGGQAPAYLATSSSEQGGGIPSPLNVGIENSRRFRGLPLYCSLLSYGRRGYADIIARNIAFARRVEQWLRATSHYEVLTPLATTSSQAGFKILNIVLFAARHECGRPELADRDSGGIKLAEAINASREMYVTATKWKGRSAVRLAVSNWQTGLREDDYGIVIKRLEQIMQ